MLGVEIYPRIYSKILDRLNQDLQDLRMYRIVILSLPKLSWYGYATLRYQTNKNIQLPTKNHSTTSCTSL